MGLHEGLQPTAERAPPYRAYVICAQPAAPSEDQAG
jgi:hypothetical protein